MNKPNLYIDFHVLQTVPPSCINRDDTGSPKTAKFGGVTRARVSSQCWKRAMRLMFQNEFDGTKFGVRTKGIVELVAQKIIQKEKSKEKDANKLALDGLKNLFKDIKDNDGIKALFFISHQQAEKLAQLIIDKNDSKEKLQEALLENTAIDIALFGRMVAIMPKLDIDAAAQVSHSISTHEVKIEYDYFTAIDDMADKETNGAAHLDVNEFNSATLYRYSTINVSELFKKLDEDDVVLAIEAFAKAFIYSMPTGKENSYANCTLPEMVYITVRNDQPVNMVGAFEKPIIAGRQGFFIPSEEAFVKYAEKTYMDFVSDPIISWGTSRGEKLSSITKTLPVNQIISEIGPYIKEKLGIITELS